MRANPLRFSLLFFASTSCAVLGIDFDKHGLSNTSSGSTTAGQGGVGGSISGAGGGGGEPESAGPNCGGFELLPSLSQASTIYRPSSSLTTCSSAWSASSDSVNFNQPTNTASCAIQSNWWFEGRGRRYSAHLTSDPLKLGTSAAGLVFTDQHGVILTVGFRAPNGDVGLSAFDPVTSTSQTVIPTIAMQTDTFLAARFSSDGSIVHIESKSSADSPWVERASHSVTDLATNLALDPSFLKPAVSQGATTGTNTAQSSFDSVQGEVVAPTTSTGACLAESFKDSFKTAVATLPDELYATTACASLVGNHLKLCPNPTPCVVRSRRLYKLDGSRLDLQVTSMGSTANDELQLGVAVPDGTTGYPMFTAFLSLLGSQNLRVEGQQPTMGVPYTTPLFLDVEELTSGTLTYKTHAPPVTAETQLGDGISFDGSLVELRFAYSDPAAGCANVSSLNTPSMP